MILGAISRRSASCHNVSHGIMSDSVCTYSQVDTSQNNIEPAKPVHNISLQTRRHGDPNRQCDDLRQLRQVRGIQAHEKIVEQVGLLAGLQPL